MSELSRVEGMRMAEGFVVSARVRESPIVGQAVIHERQPLPWVVMIPVGALLLGLLWYTGRKAHPTHLGDRLPPSGERATTPVDTSAATSSDEPGRERGVESQLVAFIKDPARSSDGDAWFNFDELRFDNDSVTVRPESEEQLRNVAAILTVYPRVNLNVGGFTDDVGSPRANLALSKARANSVMAELIRLGVAPERLKAHGYGASHPVASNEIEEGRERNRRVAFQVTKK